MLKIKYDERMMNDIFKVRYCNFWLKKIKFLWQVNNRSYEFYGRSDTSRTSDDDPQEVENLEE